MTANKAAFLPPQICSRNLYVCCDDIIYKLCIIHNATVYLGNRFYVSKRATCFDIKKYICHPQAHTILKAHI